MLLYVHGYHRYYDAGHHQEHIYNPGEVADVHEELGAVLLMGHPTKFCDVTDSQTPEEHGCEKPTVRHTYNTTVLMAPPRDTALAPRLSPQKRQLLKKAQKRSRLARLATRG